MSAALNYGRLTHCFLVVSYFVYYSDPLSFHCDVLLTGNNLSHYDGCSVYQSDPCLGSDLSSGVLGWKTACIVLASVNDFVTLILPFLKL